MKAVNSRASSRDIEYMAVTEAGKEAIWLQGLYTDIADKANSRHDYGHDTTLSGVSLIMISLRTTKVMIGRSKQVDIRHHYLYPRTGHEESRQHSKPNRAEFITKGLTTDPRQKQMNDLGI